MKNLSLPLYTLLSAVLLFFLAGLALGYRESTFFGNLEQSVHTALTDLTGNPLTQPRRYDTPSGLVRYQDVEDPGYLLLSGYLMDEGRVGIRLVDLASGTIVRSWDPDPSEIRDRSEYRDFQTVNRFEPQSPYLMDDGGLVFIDNQGPLVRIDACSNIQWVLDGRFHHSLERDLAGNFIVPGVGDGFDEWPRRFRDDLVVLVDPEGNVIEDRSVGRMLLDNGYGGLLHTAYPLTRDPIHLNDVEVAPTSTGVWERGDWLLSLRVLNAVFIYRPTTGQIIWLQVGPWLKQHDPDYLEDGTISVFGNDVVDFRLAFGHSDVYVISPSTGEVTAPYTAVLAEEYVGTPTQGRSQILANGDVFIEETDYGRLLRLNEYGLVWSFYNASDDESGLLNWSRYLPRNRVELERLPACEG